jgi:hypothetical protein
MNPYIGQSPVGTTNNCNTSKITGAVTHKVKSSALQLLDAPGINSVI